MLIKIIQGLFIVGVLGKDEVGKEPKLVPCWTMLAISSFVGICKFGS